MKRLVYWNEYKSKKEIRTVNNQNLTRFPLDASFQEVDRLLVLAFNNTAENVAYNLINNTTNRVERDNDRKYFLPRVYITTYNVLIDGRNFMINQLMIKLKI